MDAQATAKIPCAFLDLPDPRHHNIRHRLIDILTIALFAVICGAEDWVAVAEYGQAKFAWLKTFLDLPHGIPSHDTFNDFFARVDPNALERCFRKWIKSLVELTRGKLVAIDGKSLRRSFAHAWDKSGMAHMVSAFVAANHLVFAQEKTAGKGQELSAIHKLLELLDLEGAVVTIDAIGCNKEVAGKIQAAKADYLLQIKENQPLLLAKTQGLLNDAILQQLAGMDGDYCERTDGDHGRIETRKVWVVWDVQWLGADLLQEWPGLRGLIAVESEREANGRKSVERHYYLSSLDRRTKAARLAECIRGHWTVENNLHWQLDVSFHEDQRRLYKNHGPENWSRLCRISLNLLQNEKTAKCGIANKRKKSGWDNDYLLKVLAC
jgi:predicted transposase YbfD/YdcC